VSAAAAAKVAEGIGRALTILWPLIQQAGEYVAGVRDDMPLVPEPLRSPLRLARMEQRGPTKS